MGEERYSAYCTPAGDVRPRCNCLKGNAYGRLKKIRCRINRQVRTYAIHELFGLIVSNTYFNQGNKYLFQTDQVQAITNNYILLIATFNLASKLTSRSVEGFE